ASTRVSFTTTATPSAVAPAVWTVATTCPTSCTLAPTHAPKNSGFRGSPTASANVENAGRTTMASVPNSVTRAVGVAESCISDTGADGVPTDAGVGAADAGAAGRAAAM